MVPQWLGGWDWFALMLADDSSIMLGILRGIDGKPVGHSCSMVSPDDNYRHIEGDEIFGLRPLQYWTSPRTRTTYPVRWEAVIPSIDSHLTIEAAVQDQERAGSNTVMSLDYWEGPVKVTGTRAGKAVAGNGYVEMTGYGKPVAGKF
jgi:predicted secreted hydrolase